MLDLFFAALPFFYFQFVASITPGPNNVMLTASGMNFGYVRTLPHIAGVTFGFSILILLCALGIGAVYEAFPQIEIALKILGSCYLLYLAWKIVNAGRLGVKDKAAHTAKPMTFVEATLFQFVNPKAVVFAIAAVSIPDAALGFTERLTIIMVCTFINCLISTNTWAIFGKLIAELFRDDKTRHIINIILALLLLGTIPMMVM